MIERWNPEKHYELVCEWVRARNMGEHAGGKEFYPPTGFMVDKCAVGFLYLTNSAYAYFDSFMTDPSAPKEQRRGALDRLAEALAEEADRHGVRIAQAYVLHEHIKEDFVNVGFVRYNPNYELLIRIR